MIYFNEDKEAFAFEIPNYIAVIDDATWAMYAGTDKWDIINGEFVDITDTPEYQEEQRRKERERLNMLSLTRGDVFRGILQAKGITKAQLRANIEAMPEGLQKEMALIDFDDALNFFRGNPLVDTVGALLDITSEQLDRFFETNDYHELMNDEPELEQNEDLDNNEGEQNDNT